MPELGWVGLGVAPDFTGFKSKTERETSKVMTAAGVSGGEKFGDAAGKAAGSRFKARMKSAAKIAAVGLAGASVAAFKFAGDSLAEAREAQKIGAQTDAVIKSTGKAAKVTARDIGNLSGRLSEMAGIDDEIIQNGANVLLTFTKIRNEAGEGNKVFDRATAAALNMSVALGSDLSSASIQVGKALNDPEKGVTALGRAGVQFTDQQKDQIKTLVDSGRQLDAQKMILRELDTQFRGSARAQATESDKLTVAWGNFKEEVGTSLIPVMDDLATLLQEKGIPAARDFFGWVKDTGIPAVKDFKDEVTPVAEKVGELVGYLNDLPKSVKIGGLASLAALFGASKLRGGGGGALGTAGKALGIAKPVPVIVMNPGAIGGGVPGVPGAPGGGKPGRHAATPKGLGGKVGGALGFLAGIPLPALGGMREMPALRPVSDFRKLTNDTRSDVERLDTTIKTMGPYRVGLSMPALAPLMGQVKQYEGILDDLDRRQVTTYIRTISDNNVVEDIGGRGGKTPAGYRATTNDNRIVINGDVRPHNFSEFERDMSRKRRGRAGGKR